MDSLQNSGLVFVSATANTPLMKTKILLAIPILLLACCHTVENRTVNKYDFKKESGINGLNVSEKLINDLFVVCKIWGFLKYHHPTVATSPNNWDEDLFKILPSIIDSKSNDSRNKILSDWVGKLGTSANKIPFQRGKSFGQFYPDTSWLYDTQLLGKKLSSKLVRIKNSFVSDTNRYVELRQDLNPIFTGNPYWHNKFHRGFVLANEIS